MSDKNKRHAKKFILPEGITANEIEIVLQADSYEAGTDGYIVTGSSELRKRIAAMAKGKYALPPMSKEYLAELRKTGKCERHDSMWCTSDEALARSENAKYRAGLIPEMAAS